VGRAGGGLSRFGVSSMGKRRCRESRVLTQLLDLPAREFVLQIPSVPEACGVWSGERTSSELKGVTIGERGLSLVVRNARIVESGCDRGDQGATAIGLQAQSGS
jgi:hypothetical protein